MATKGTQGKNRDNKRVFKNFAEYWHYVKVLSQNQREALVQSLSIQERQSLHASFEKGGWNDLMMRNTCDEILGAIKDRTKTKGNSGLDLLELRAGIVMHGKSQLVQRRLWEYVNKCFEKIKWEHISYIFDGIVAEEFDTDYIKLSAF
jgi:hypothetical protein